MSLIGHVTQTTKTLIDHFITNSKTNLTKWGTITTSISDHYLIYAIWKVGGFQEDHLNLLKLEILKISLKLNLLMTSKTQYGNLQTMRTISGYLPDNAKCYYNHETEGLPLWAMKCETRTITVYVFHIRNKEHN